MPEPVFEWYVDKVGKYRFRLKAANGEMIAVSEGYASKQGCVDGIESVKKKRSNSKNSGSKRKRLANKLLLSLFYCFSTYLTFI